MNISSEIIHGKKGRRDRWILSYYRYARDVLIIYKYNNYFDSFNDKLSSKLSLSDDLKAEVISVSKVKIQTFDGVVDVLEDMIYVPKIPKYLISSSLSNSYGYNYKVRGGF